MKRVTIYFKDKDVLTYEVEIEDFSYIVEELYTKYGDAIGFEIKDLEKVKKYEKYI